MLERIHWTEGELQEYDRIGMAMADARGRITAAKKEGREEGIKGEKIATALRLLQEGFSIERVAKMTMMDMAEVEKIEGQIPKSSVELP